MRPSKLTLSQWRQIHDRMLTGEAARALAREFGVSETAIRKKFAGSAPEREARMQERTARIRATAEKLAAAEDALQALPLSARPAALALADRLRNVSHSLASAAELGAQTAHRLAALANSEAAKVDDAEPLQDEATLRGVVALTRAVNEAASVALSLLSANRDSLRQPPPQGREAQPVNWQALLAGVTPPADD